MNRDAFIDRLAARLGDRPAARAALDALIAEARSAAMNGETLSVAGLLITYPAQKAAKTPAKKATKSTAKTTAKKTTKGVSGSPGPAFPTGRQRPVG